MLELGSWGEFIIILVAVLILIKPAEFPVLLRTLGRWIQKLRLLSLGVRQHLETYLHEAEFEDLQKRTNEVILSQEKPKKTLKKSSRPRKKTDKKRKDIS